MAGLLSKVSRFARSPKGRQLVNRAKTMSRDPETRRKVDAARRRFATRRR